MVSKSLLCTVLVGVLVSCCHGQECPSNMVEISTWFMDSISTCMKEMMKSLRADKDKSNCGDILSTNDACIGGKVSSCADETADAQLKMIIQSLAGGANMSTSLNGVFCTGESLDAIDGAGGAVQELEIPQCDSNALSAAIEDCSKDFVPAFKADPIDTKLCKLYDEMTECEFTKIKEGNVCQQVDQSILDGTEKSRKDSNFFCVDTAVDDGGSAGYLKISTFGFLILSLLSIWYMF
ncbi:uncharacterized protein LOC144452077 [Glandiceps talaboti]